VLGIEPRILNILGKCYTTEVYPSPGRLFWVSFDSMELFDFIWTEDFFFGLIFFTDLSRDLNTW
jgi:hypothetical protein